MKNFPLVDYDERYFSHSKHNAKELYDCQRKILTIIEKGSIDILKDLNSKIDPKEIDLMLRDSFQMGLTKKRKNRNDNNYSRS